MVIRVIPVTPEVRRENLKQFADGAKLEKEKSNHRFTASLAGVAILFLVCYFEEYKKYKEIQHSSCIAFILRNHKIQMERMKLRSTQN